MTYFMLSWKEPGAVYTRSFYSLKERDAFRKLVERKDWKGLSNVSVWERTTMDTIPYSGDIYKEV